MNEDGEFVCEEHQPEKRDGQWWVDATEVPAQCDHCNKPVKFYVLETA